MSLSQMSRLAVTRLAPLSRPHPLLLLTPTVSPLVTSKRTNIQQPYRRPGQSKKEKLPRVSFAKGVENVKGNFQLLKEESSELLVGPGGKPLKEHMLEQNRVVWDFREPESLKKWIVSSDQEIGGQSEAYLKLGRNNKTCFFYGTLCTTPPKDGETRYSGYCSMKSKQLKSSFDRNKHYDWTSFNTLHLRVRGDGRTWMVNIASEMMYSHNKDDMYSYFLFTRGGPYWQEVKIPFSKFFLTHRGRIQDGQYFMMVDKVNTIGFTLADKVDGPFQLEIDFIGVDIDYAHTEEFAYENYKRNPEV